MFHTSILSLSEITTVSVRAPPLWPAMLGGSYHELQSVSINESQRCFLIHNMCLFFFSGGVAIFNCLGNMYILNMTEATFH